MPQILLDAVYINQSGGKILLEFFIKNLIIEEKITDFFFLLDDRLESEIINDIPLNQQTKIHPGEKSRSRFYQQHHSGFDKFFCFGNVPPPIKQVKKQVYVLFHNALILNSKNMNYSYIEQFLFFLKRQYIRYKNQKNYTWLVQTNNMKRLLSKGLSISSSSIKVLPFYESNRYTKVNKRLEINRGNFLYVANGVEQKNHRLLFAAWEYILDKYRLPITLHLTIPLQYTSLINEIKRLQDKGADLINHGICNGAAIELLYSKCNTYLTPSFAESFGLPIIEAAEAGCEVLAADLPYVYDIISPLATFDPHDEKEFGEKIRLAFLQSYGNWTQLRISNKINEIINLIT